MTKKSMLTFAAAAFMATALTTSCSTPAEKVEDAQENAAEAKQDLDEANQEYMIEMESYRQAAIERIAANDKSTAEFKARIAKEKKEAKAEYEKKIAELDEKNSDMKKRLDEYKASGKENWEKFKAEFGRDMDTLGSAFRNFNIKNNK